MLPVPASNGRAAGLESGIQGTIVGLENTTSYSLDCSLVGGTLGQVPVLDEDVRML